MYEVKVVFPDEATWDEVCLLARLAGARSPAEQIAEMVIVGLPTALAEYQEVCDRPLDLVTAGAAEGA